MRSDQPGIARCGNDGLRNRQLKRLRTEAGWKQSQLLLRLEGAGERLGVRVAPRSSLKTMVSRWENGAPMSNDYRRLFRDVYGTSDEGLGFSTAKTSVPEPNSDELEAWDLADIMTRSSVSAAALTVMERSVLGYASRYPDSPPADLMPHVRQQMRRLRAAIEGPQPIAVRRRSIALLGVLAGVAGHLAFDLGAFDRAVAMFDVGRLAGSEAEDDDLLAWLAGTESICLFASQNYLGAANKLMAARQYATASSRRRQAWIAGMQARSHAAVGCCAVAMSALDEARGLLDATDDEPGGTDFFDHARLDGLAGATHLLLRDTAAASKLLDRALQERGTTDAKGRAFLTLDLAGCRLIEREPEETVRLSNVALDIARGTLIRPILDRVRLLCSSPTGGTCSS